MSDTDVLVLRRGTHGMPASDYGEALKERLTEATVRVARTPQEERELAPDARVISSVDVDRELIEQATDLELFAGVAAGYEHLPLKQLAKRGVAVTNASGIHAPNIAEQVLGYILGHVRSLGVARDRQDRRQWRHFQVGEFKGSTVTIVGLGAIGRAIAERVAAFEVDTVGVRNTPEKGGPTDEVIGFDKEDIHAALAETDHLVIASPLTETTRALIGSKEFETLPPHSYLVNVGRGPIVDTDALVDALRSNDIAGAGLDVTDPEPLPADHPLWGFKNVTITPHNGGHSPKHWDRLSDIVAENVERIAAGEDISTLKNLVQEPA